MGCFDNGTVELQAELDAEEVFYVDFDREEVVYTWPRYIMVDLSGILSSSYYLLKDAKKAKDDCPVIMTLYKQEFKNPTEETGKLTSTFHLVTWLIRC